MSKARFGGKMGYPVASGEEKVAFDLRKTLKPSAPEELSIDAPSVSEPAQDSIAPPESSSGLLPIEDKALHQTSGRDETSPTLSAPDFSAEINSAGESAVGDSDKVANQPELNRLFEEIGNGRRTAEETFIERAAHPAKSSHPRRFDDLGTVEPSTHEATESTRVPDYMPSGATLGDSVEAKRRAENSFENISQAQVPSPPGTSSPGGLDKNTVGTSDQKPNGVVTDAAIDTANPHFCEASALSQFGPQLKIGGEVLPPLEARPPKSIIRRKVGAETDHPIRGMVATDAKQSNPTEVQHRENKEGRSETLESQNFSNATGHVAHIFPDEGEVGCELASHVVSKEFYNYITKLQEITQRKIPIQQMQALLSEGA